MEFYKPTLTVGMQHLNVSSPLIKRLSLISAAWVFFTAMSGGFVAGLDAGMIFNEWPTMANKLIPVEELFHLDPWWRNFFDHNTTVQFNHRIAAYATVFLVMTLSILSRKASLPANVAIAMRAVQAAVLLQFTLGVMTLLSGVKTHVAATHQGGALALYTTLLWLVFTLRLRVPIF
jgi:cytochrome c oxidase assembly protein subunit 15